jgi:hypothetical protein
MESAGMVIGSGEAVTEPVQNPLFGTTGAESNVNVAWRV